MKKEKTSHYLGHRKRIKEKYKKAGFSGWHDYEVLEFALSYALPRKDTKPIAKKLLQKFKSLQHVLDADLKELQEISGISEHSALFVKFLKDIAIQYSEAGMNKKDLMLSPEAVYNYLKTLLKGLKNEEFRVLFLDSRNGVIDSETIYIGTVNKAVVYPRKVIERALYHNAVGVIIAHNHPSGIVKPSEEDHKVTKTIIKVLKTIDVMLIDHIVVGEEGYYSFKEQGLLEE